LKKRQAVAFRNLYVLARKEKGENAGRRGRASPPFVEKGAEWQAAPASCLEGRRCVPHLRKQTKEPEGRPLGKGAGEKRRSSTTTKKRNVDNIIARDLAAGSGRGILAKLAVQAALKNGNED